MRDCARRLAAASAALAIAANNLPHPDERALARVSKDGPRASWFETREDKAPHHEESHYNIGRLRGLGPRGKALSMAAISSPPSTRSPAAAFSAACSGVEAFGIANTRGSCVRKLKATWRGDAPWASAILCSTSPALPREDGKSL